jgi:hypothetical protein
MRFNFYRYQNDEPENTGGGAGDVPLGDKGQKALEAMKAKVRELEKQNKELADKTKPVDGLTPEQIQEAIEFQRTAKIEQAEREKNTEEQRKLEREQAAAKEKRLLAEKEAAEKDRTAARRELNETHVNTAVVLAVSESAYVAGNDHKEVANNRKALCKIINSVPELRKQLAYLTVANDGVDEDGVYIVDKNNDPIYDPDDRNKYLDITDWVNTKVRADYSGMFKSSIGTGDGLSGKRGKRGGGIDVASLAAMTPLQRLEHHRKMNAR